MQPRFAGSGAFYDSARRGRSSQSASPVPGQILNEISKRQSEGASAGEIAEAIGVTLRDATGALDALENLGMIVHHGTSARYVLSAAGQRALEMSYLAIA